MPTASKKAATKPATKPAAKTPNPTTSPPPDDAVPSMMEIRTYDAKKCVSAVVSLERVRDRAFIIQSKLVHRLKTQCNDPMPILMAAGVAKGTVSNALTGAVVIEALLDPNLIEESIFDRFTFSKVLSIARVMSGASIKKLHPDQIAQFIKDLPQHTGKRKPADFVDFQDELESIFATGLTLEQAAEKAATEAAQKLQREQEAAALASRTPAASDTAPPPPGAAPSTTPTASTTATETQPQPEVQPEPEVEIEPEIEPEIEAEGEDTQPEEEDTGAETDTGDDTPADTENIVPFTPPANTEVDEGPTAIPLARLLEACDMVEDAAPFIASFDELNTLLIRVQSLGQKICALCDAIQPPAEVAA